MKGWTTDWEILFISHISERRLGSIICKELSNLYRKKKTAHLGNGQKHEQTDIHQEEGTGDQKTLERKLNTIGH